MAALEIALAQMFLLISWSSNNINISLCPIMSCPLDLDLADTYLYRKVLGGKDKKEKFLKHKDFYLEVKGKMNKSPKCEMDSTVQAENFNTISIDVWYQISLYIHPEDVQNFALICKDTFALARTKSFWKNLFKNHCLKLGTKIWILQLPAYLQYDSIRDLNNQMFRTSVIEALFYSYPPLIRRLNNYTLDFVIGREYLSAWHMQRENCTWTVCYKFRQHRIPKQRTGYRNEERTPSTCIETTKDLVNDWEFLADCDENENFMFNNDDSQSRCAEEINPYEGVCLLVIFGHRFIPFHTQLTYSRERAPFLRLAATRLPLTRDMREYNLELDFEDKINRTVITVNYSAAKHKVLPWWHPDFKNYINYEACDTFL